MDPSRPQLVILMRHGERARTWRQPEQEQRLYGWTGTWQDDPGAAPTPLASGDESKSDFQRKGLPFVRAMAGRLADELELEGVREATVVYSWHLVAVDTAEVVRSVLERRRITVRANAAQRDLTPPGLRSSSNRASAADRVATFLREPVVDGHAWIVVGHQPGLTHVAAALLKRAPIPGLPLDNAEMACIAIGEKPRLTWLLTKGSDSLATELKAKVQSKFQLAGMFVSSLLIESGLIASKEPWSLENPLAPALVLPAYAALLTSLGLGAATLFAYDELSMPPKFWSEAVGKRRWWHRRDTPPMHRPGDPPPWSVRRPPSDANTIVYCEMVNIWNRLFLPALACALVTIALLLTAFATGRDKSASWSDHGSTGWIAACAVCFFLTLVVSFLGFRWFRPAVGVND